MKCIMLKHDITRHYDMTLNIALNYGGRDEIIEATKNILKEVEMGKMNIEELKYIETI